MNLISAALVLIVAILIALFVIQPVAIDTHPGVLHEKIVFIWGLNISFNILTAYSLVLISVFSNGKGWIIPTVLIILLFIVFVLAFACNDAALAYRSHGPKMQSVSVILFFCAAIEVIVWLLLFSTLLFRKKITLPTQAAF